MTLVCCLTLSATAQEAPPQQPKEPPKHNFDQRCISAVKWSAQLIAARQAGVTEDQVIAKMREEFAQKNQGSLESVNVPMIRYLLEILDMVYASPLKTNDDLYNILDVTNGLCVTFLDDHSHKHNSKEEVISWQ